MIHWSTRCIASAFRIGVLLISSPVVFASEFSDYQTKTQLIFPLSGESIITSGGRTLDENHHLSLWPAERYALDIAGLTFGSKPLSKEEIAYYKKNGLTINYSGDPKNNDSYFCFGRNVIAPATGVIAGLGRGVKDNIPGELNHKNPRGNYVLIDHGNNEFSMLLHLRLNSIPQHLNKGMSVFSEYVIGQCGNSGLSRVPHLHYHLQNSASYDADGLPAQFSNYVSNGQSVERGEPVLGQIIMGGVTIGTILN